jgi:dipeptidyl aminopeptidase/acylaminoacyl peptidase
VSGDMRCGTWVEHFPGNLRWSNAMQIVKGMAAYGAVAMEEVDRVGARLTARAGENDLDRAWREEWVAMADRVAKRADIAAARGCAITAGHNYIRAGNYYYSGERFVPPSEDKLALHNEKLAIYHQALRCWHAAFDRLYPQIERVDVPYEDAALAAYFMRAPGAPSRAPTVVLFNGMDNCKEMSVVFAGLEFAKRGINTLAIDGPGQGESLRLRKIHSRPDYEVAGTAAYDYVASRPDVDTGKVAVMGYSFGGYLAPRIVAFEHRYAACVAFGAMHWDLHGWQREIKECLAADPKTSTSSNFQFRWVIGAPDNATALEWAKRFTLAGCIDKIACPVLVLHGENDRIVPVEEARTLHANLTTRKHLKIFTADEGGTEHCQVDNRPVGMDYIADWLVETFGLPPR